MCMYTYGWEIDGILQRVVKKVRNQIINIIAFTELGISSYTIWGSSKFQRIGLFTDSCPEILMHDFLALPNYVLRSQLIPMF
jgi:hypothetical protein